MVFDNVNLADIYDYFYTNINNLLEDNYTFVAIVVAAIIGKMKEGSKSSIWKAWIVFFVGTFFHELAHFIVSLITFGKPSSFNVFPSKDKETNMITLGYVTSRNMRWYNAFFISMAPLLLIPLSYYVYTTFFTYFEFNIYTMFIQIFLIVTLLFSSIPSGTDFKNIIKL